jgi:hypothetical protein
MFPRFRYNREESTGLYRLQTIRKRTFSRLSVFRIQNMLLPDYGSESGSILLGGVRDAKKHIQGADDKLGQTHGLI